MSLCACASSSQKAAGRRADPEVVHLTRCIHERRDLVVEYLALCRAADLADETIH